MKNLTRRSFVARAAAASTTILSLFTTTTHASEAQLVWRASQWNLAEFQKLLRDPAKIKQVHDVVPIADGTFLNGMKNSLNALQFGFGIPKEQIKVVGALHGPANMLNYDDYVWNKYQIGEWLDVIDPLTGKPAVRNIFYKSKHSPEQLSGPIDPDDESSVYQDRSMQALQWRGVQFMSCHTALEEQAQVLVRLKWSEECVLDVHQPCTVALPSAVLHTQVASGCLAPLRHHRSMPAGDESRRATMLDA